MPVELHLLRPLWLLALPPLALLWWWAGRAAHPRGGWKPLVDPHLRRHVLAAPMARAHRGPWWLVGLGALLLVLALTGPAWRQQERPVLRIERAQVLVLDLSPAMDRADLPPNRIARARFELLDLLAALDEGHTGLIVYGVEPFLVAPLTTDTATIAEQVPALTTAVLPVSGPARPALALDLAHALLRQTGANQGLVILLSAGLPAEANTLRATLDASRALRADGHRVSVLAILAAEGSSATGGAIGGTTGELAALRSIAATGGGDLVLARPDDADLIALLQADSRGAPGATAPAGARPTAWRDDGPWLLLALLPLAVLAARRGWIGLLPLALGLSLGLPLGLPPGPALAGTGTTGTPLPASALGLAPAADPAEAPGSARQASLAQAWANLWWRPDQQAVAALVAGDLERAGARFADPQWRALARYRAGDFDGALQLLRGQRGVAAHYNRGNVLARLGRWQDAIGEYDAALLLDPPHQDARHNRALVQGLLSPTAVATGAEAGIGEGTGTGDGNDADADTAGAATPDDNEFNVAAPTAGTHPRPGAIDHRADGRSDDQVRDDGGKSAGADAGSHGFRSSINAAASAATGQSNADTPAAAPADHGGPPPAVAPAPQRALARVAADRAPDGGDAAGDDEASDDGRGTGGNVRYLLRQVEDDPGALLRERLMLQYLRRHGQLD